jgi:hypothetical protein
MSGRKRHARHDPSDPMHWNKEQYIHHLKEMGIDIEERASVAVFRAQVVSLRSSSVCVAPLF